MTKILLTGGSGFIGRNIKESYLTDKYSIFAPSHAELDLLDDSSLDSFFLKHPNIDLIIHGACKPGHRNAKDTHGIFDHNTRLFNNITRMSDRVRKILIIGSGAIYDNRNYQHKMKESYAGTNIPVDEHGLCKYKSNKIIERSKNIIDLRVFGIFGKYEDYAIRFISNMCCKALFDLPLTMNQNRLFDYIDVDDFIIILDKFIERDAQYKAYNITPICSYELLKIAEMVRDISKKTYLEIKIAKEGMGLPYTGDNTLLCTEFSDIIFTPLYRSIEVLYNWYQGNKSTINRNLLLNDK